MFNMQFYMNLHVFLYSANSNKQYITPDNSYKLLYTVIEKGGTLISYKKLNE